MKITAPAIAPDTYGVATLVRVWIQVDGLWTGVRYVVWGADVKLMARNAVIICPMHAAVIVCREVIGAVIWAVVDLCQRVSVQRLDGTASAGMDSGCGRSGRRSSSHAARTDQAGYHECGERTYWLHGS